MKKTVCIEPADDEMELAATAVRLKNDFILKGVDTRNEFVRKVGEKLPDYANVEGVQVLYTFWQLRAKDAKLNKDLQKVLDQI